MARLPNHGEENWGQILNEYLLVSHTDDGHLKGNAVVGPELYPEDFGAIMDDPNSATINDSAITALINSIPDSGGVMIVTGELYISQTIVYPKRAFSNTDPPDQPRSINFSIRGNSVRSKINQTTNNFAIEIETITPAQYKPKFVKETLQDIMILSQGSGIKVIAGGKSVVLSNIIISQCQGKYGLHIESFYGGVLDRVYCFDNANVGLWMENCNMVNLHGLTARANGDHGIVMRNCVGLSGYLYSEANSGLALDAFDMKESSFSVWFEANNGEGGLDRIQARLRSSINNRFFGKTGVGRHVAFDADPISRSLNIIEGEGGIYGDTYHSKFACDYFGMLTSQVTQLLHANSFSRPHGNSQSTWSQENTIIDIDNTVGYSDNQSLKVTIKAGAYSNLPDPSTPAWLEPFRWGSDALGSPLSQLTYSANDWLIIRFRAKTDEQGAQFYKSQLENDRGYALRIAFNGGPSSLGNKQATLTNTDWHTIEWIAQLSEAGNGLRLFFYFGSGITAGPAAAHNIWIDDVEVYHIPNTDSDEYVPARPPILINDDNNGYPQSAKTFQPGVYITAPRLEIRSNITTPLVLQEKKIFYNNAIPNEVVERGSICFNTEPLALGHVGWSCVNSIHTKSTNSGNMHNGRNLDLPANDIENIEIGDKIGVVVNRSDMYSKFNIHWTSISNKNNNSVEIADSLPDNSFIQPNSNVWVMCWKSFGTIAA